MESPTRGGLQSLTAGYMIVAFAVAMLISYAIDDWWMFIPIFLIEAGAFWGVTGFLFRPSGKTAGSGSQDSPFYVFWGISLALIGLIWIVNSQYPGNGVLLLGIFLIWVGAVAVVLALLRLRKSSEVPR